MNTFKISFGAKLTALVITIVFAAVATVGFFSVTTMRNNLEKEAQLKEQMLAEAFAAQVEQFLVDAMGMVRTIAQTETIKDVSMVPQIREDIKGVPRDVAVDKRQIMSHVINNYGDFAYMEQITAPGRGDNIVLEPWEFQLDLQRLDFGFRDWAQQAIAKNDTHISEVYTSSSLNKPVVAISHPVHNDNGELTSVVMGALTIDRLSEFCSQLQYGDTGQAYLVDQNGVLAAHPNSELVAEIKDVTDIPMVQKALQGETGNGIFYDPLVDTEVYAHYMPIANTGWSLVIEQSVDEMYAPINAAINRILVICVILLTIAIAIALWMARSITRPINSLLVATDKAANGDLTTKINITSNDEIGKLASGFNHMLDNLRKLVLQIQNTSHKLAFSTSELSANAEETTAGANETASTITEVSSTVEQSSKNAQTIQATAEMTTEEAEKGHQGIQRIVGQMQDISSSTQIAARAINSLDEMSGKIGVIVETITNIADQTNLLALNAAIEAARAGEQGRGFAVVAEEVRKLAEQSAGAAQEIQQLIAAVQGESKQASDTMHQSAEDVQKGVDVVNEVGRVFIKSIDKIKGLAVQVDEITHGTEQVATAVEHVASTTEETTAAMEEIASSIDTLTKMADELQQLAAQFKVDNAGTPSKSTNEK